MASLAPLRARVQSFRYIQFVFFERFTYPGFIGLLSALFSPQLQCRVEVCTVRRLNCALCLVVYAANLFSVQC